MPTDTTAPTAATPSARRMLARARAASRANREAMLLAAVVEVAEDLAAAFLRDHPLGCCCPSCQLIPVDEMEEVRGDVRTIRTMSEMLGSVLRNELISHPDAVDVEAPDTFGAALRLLADEADRIDAQEDAERAA